MQRFYGGAAESGILAEATATITSALASDEAAVVMLAEYSFENTQDITVDVDVGIESSADFRLYRLRRVNEMDEFTLSDYDAMSLYDLDYILVE